MWRFGANANPQAVMATAHPATYCKSIQDSSGNAYETKEGIFLRRTATDEFQVCYEYFSFCDDSRS